MGASVRLSIDFCTRPPEESQGRGLLGEKVRTLEWGPSTVKDGTPLGDILSNSPCKSSAEETLSVSMVGNLSADDLFSPIKTNVR
jgi:hypothetical protein